MFGFSRLFTALFDGADARTRLFRVCAALSLTLHAILIFRRPELWGGGDLVPHLRIIELIRQAPGL
ncbi:MAG: hypothetical protein JSU66_16235, partial [Deltaproteobacteria bacterium]